MTRRHHPIAGIEFEVLAHGRVHLCIRLKDGTPMHLPRRWTDADGPTTTPGTAGPAEAVFMVESLGDLGNELEQACAQFGAEFAVLGGRLADLRPDTLKRRKGLRRELELRDEPPGDWIGP